jgi:ATP-dependent DNA ligase
VLIRSYRLLESIHSTTRPGCSRPKYDGFRGILYITRSSTLFSKRDGQQMTGMLWFEDEEEEETISRAKWIVDRQLGKA